MKNKSSGASKHDHSVSFIAQVFNLKDEFDQGMLYVRVGFEAKKPVYVRLGHDENGVLCPVFFKDFNEALNDARAFARCPNRACTVKIEETQFTSELLQYIIAGLLEDGRLKVA